MKRLPSKNEIAAFIKANKVNKIESFMKRNKVTNYTINEDYSVTVNEKVVFKTTPKFKIVEALKPAFKVLSVLYGIKGVNVINVTDKVEVGGKVTNKIAGSDPVKGKKKQVYVTALVDGIETEKTFIEGKELVW